MSNDMDILVLCFIQVEVLVPIYVHMDEYGGVLWILFCC